MPEVVVAATQMACSPHLEANLDQAESLAREAAENGVQVVLVQAQFEIPCFRKAQDARHVVLARPFEGNPIIEGIAALARRTATVLSISFFERAGTAQYNAVAVPNLDGYNRPPA